MSDSKKQAASSCGSGKKKKKRKKMKYKKQMMPKMAALELYEQLEKTAWIGETIAKATDNAFSTVGGGAKAKKPSTTKRPLPKLSNPFRGKSNFWPYPGSKQKGPLTHAQAKAELTRLGEIKKPKPAPAPRPAPAPKPTPAARKPKFTDKGLNAKQMLKLLRDRQRSGRRSYRAIDL